MVVPQWCVSAVFLYAGSVVIGWIPRRMPELIAVWVVCCVSNRSVWVKASLRARVVFLFVFSGVSLYSFRRDWIVSQTVGGVDARLVVRCVWVTSV